MGLFDQVMVQFGNVEESWFRHHGSLMVSPDQISKADAFFSTAGSSSAHFPFGRPGGRGRLWRGSWLLQAMTCTILSADPRSRCSGLRRLLEATYACGF